MLSRQIVTEIVGREVATLDEYRELFGHGPEKLSPEKRDLLTIAWSHYTFDCAIPGSLYVFGNCREIAPDRWFPFHVRASGWHHNDNNEQYYSFFNSETVVTEVRTDRIDLKSHWKPLLPLEGEGVQDQRFAVSVDYEYQQDRTDEEIQAMVNKQLFEFARSQILIDAASSPLRKPVGKPAFALREPQAKGKVLAVEPGDGLAVISVGIDDGFKQDQVLDIMRDENRIGQLGVVLVRENRSVGKVSLNSDAKGLRKGDIAQS